jgi:mannose-6-phosphate isomerase-like protein (cupin superfamily)
MNIVSKNQALDHYHWGDNCDCWNLVLMNELSIKLERMPSHTAEEKHFHRQSNQFFFILQGEAIFELGQTRKILGAQEGILVEMGTKHRILNESDTDLEFLLVSQPPATDDRINIEEQK